MDRGKYHNWQIGFLTIIDCAVCDLSEGFLFIVKCSRDCALHDSSLEKCKEHSATLGVCSVLLCRVGACGYNSLTISLILQEERQF